MAGTWGHHGQRGEALQSVTVEMPHCLGSALVSLLEERYSPTHFLSVCFLALDSNLNLGIAWPELLSYPYFNVPFSKPVCLKWIGDEPFSSCKVVYSLIP